MSELFTELPIGKFFEQMVENSQIMNLSFILTGT